MPVDPDRVPPRDQTAARVHRQRPPEHRDAVAHESNTLAGRREPKALVALHLRRRGRVVHLGEVDVAGPDARLLVRRVRGARHARMVLAVVVVGIARRERGAEDADRPVAGVAARW